MSRGGKREGAGRPSIYPKDAKLKCYKFRLTPEQEKVVDEWIKQIRKKYKIRRTRSNICTFFQR